MRLSPSAARALTRVAVRPVLGPGLPIGLRRRLLDVTGLTLPSPRGTRRATGDLGGIPTVRVTAPGAVGPHQVLFLHGGGYTVGSALSHRALIAHLSRATGAPVHVPAYRLAPEHPYPAAVDDALTAYRALRAAGHDAQRIAVAGDSAGGGLAVALVLRLRAAGEELPGALGLISPWVDLDLRSPTLESNRARDALLSPDWLAGAADEYRAGADAPELRPLDADLAGLPPTHVVAATGEILLGDADELVARLRAAAVPVTYRREPDLWHDYVLYAGLMKAADETVAELGTTLRTHCTPP